MEFCLKLAGFAVAASLATAVPANAKTTETTKYYNVTGKTGMELFRDMNRRGPKHGFLTKAIAQTQFKPDVRGQIVFQDGICRTKNARYAMQITYVYPKVTGKLDPRLAARWRTFLAAVVRHEQAHGRLGRKLVDDINRTMRNFKMADRQSCRKADAALTKQVNAMVVAYNKSQRDFDKREHRPGGPVEKSTMALIGKK